MARIARMIHSQVGRDAIQPGGELGAGFVFLARAINAQKNFLRQFFRHGRITRHAIHKIHHRPAIFLQQIIEGSLIACLHSQHHFGITETIRRKTGLAVRRRHSAPYREQPAIHGYAAHTGMNPSRGRKLRLR